MNIKDIDLNLLSVFTAVYQTQNISRAAERLGMSQPATSNALNRLRKILQDPLFVRNSRGVTPTQHAKELAPTLTQALDLIQNCLNEKTDFNYATAEREFNIAMSDYCEFLLMPRVIDWLSKFAPGVRINVWPIEGGDTNEAFIHEKLDLALGNIPYLIENYRMQGLFDEDFTPIMRVGHPRGNDDLTLEEFVSLPHAIFTPRYHHKDMASRPAADKEWQHQAALQVPNFMSLVAIVSQSDLVAAAPLRSINAFREIYPVKTISLPVEFPRVKIYQYWHETKHNDPSLKWLRDLIFKFCQNF
ncbi:MAG: LysR family transcriptional regulator [Agarilytica sp.]